MDEIGVRLRINQHTVGYHRRALMRRLDLRTRLDLVRYGIAQDMIPPDPVAPPD